jgi:hypothetical protein
LKPTGTEFEHHIELNFHSHIYLVRLLTTECHAALFVVMHKLSVCQSLGSKVNNLFLTESERDFNKTWAQQQIDASGARGDTSLRVPPWPATGCGAGLDE